MRSRACVATEAGARYAKQLATHLGHRVPVAQQPDGAWSVDLGAARGRILATEHGVSLEADAPDETSLAEVEHVLGDHLQRFGRRHELSVTWIRLPT